MFSTCMSACACVHINNNNNNVVFNPGDLYYLSVLIQRYNAILLHDCFVKEEEE